MKKKIVPIISKCKCGEKVVNHHFLCDECWNKKNREKNKHLLKIIPKRYNSYKGGAC